MIINGKFITPKVPIEKFKDTINDKKINESNIPQNQNFSEILKNKINKNQEIKISKHAEIRMNQRNINITDELKDKINKSIDKASAKGIKDSLVLVDNNAFIVNVRSRTIVTAFNKDELKDNVISNIDGAVID